LLDDRHLSVRGRLNVQHHSRVDPAYTRATMRDAPCTRVASLLRLRSLARASVLGGLVAVLLSASAISTIQPRSCEAGWWDDLDKGEPVRLSDLIAEPTRWQRKTVTFSCIFHAPDSVFQPFFTSFNAEQHVNFTAWIDGSPLWEVEAFLRDEFPYLYVRRDHPQWAELSRLPTFTRIEVTGFVKDIYRQRPWIEIKGYRVSHSTLGKKVVDWVKTGDGFASSGDVTNAEQYYRTALAEEQLDETYRIRISKRLAELLRAAGRSNDAKGVDGGIPTVGGTETPLPTPGTLTDARPSMTPATPAAPPSPISGLGDLPGVPYGTPTTAPPRRDEPLRPTGTPLPRSALDGPGAPPPAISGPGDLPGVPYAAPRPPAPPTPPARSLAPVPASRPIPTTCPPAPAGAPVVPAASGENPAGPAVPAGLPPSGLPTADDPHAAPPPPTTVSSPTFPKGSAGAIPPDAAPATGAPQAPPTPAPAPPPPPPPRTPRLSGVK
jgi:hypothetical protein